MGANAQTTVPTFTTGQVLTATQMNDSARTGVPVFATTVERDAAFGGSGEKTLAEGQLCYLESTNVVQYYDGAAWATVGPSTSGVTLISTTTIGSGVSSHAVTSCFSSTYDNYRITVNGGVGSSSNTHILFQLGATTTGYYWASIAASSGGTSGDSGSNAASWQAGDVNTDYLNLSMNIFSPNLAKYTVFDSGGFNLANGNVRFRSGYQASTTQFTGFTLIPATGTLTGGTVRVYGLQNS